MAVCINQSGTWRNASTLCVNESGTWRNIQTGCVNESGTWRKFGFGPPVPLGTSYEGGTLIAYISGVSWVAAPAGTEVCRSWTSRSDAVTCAEASAACGDWFIPDRTPLVNPGWQCRVYWDSYSECAYWSESIENNPGQAFAVNFTGGDLRVCQPGFANQFPPAAPIPDGSFAWAYKSRVTAVRAFRCVI
jgi:hypothetical protein